MTPSDADQSSPPGCGISLILCTINSEKRLDEIERLLESVRQQSYSNIEVVVVDQNYSFDLPLFLTRWEGSIKLRIVRSGVGLSKSRNVGLAVATYSVVAFPDDDCWYPTDVLDRVMRLFAEQASVDGFFGRGCDAAGRDIARFKDTEAAVTKFNVFETSASITMFIRAAAISAVDGFDEELGLGSGTRWTGGEDYDLPIRMLAAGASLRYLPSLVVHHPRPDSEYGESLVRRATTQSPSFGRLLKVHGYPRWFAAYRIARPLGGAVVALCGRNRWGVRYHLEVVRGRVKGYSSR